MRSPAYLDFVARLREAIILVRIARCSTNADVAAACSKSAAVLLAAALERYVNSVLEFRCQKIVEIRWDQIPVGVQKLLCIQISRRLRDITDQFKAAADMTVSRQRRLRRVVTEAERAFQDPSSWRHFPEFGMFMEGLSVPDRLNSVLRDFHPEGESLFDTLEDQGQNRSAIARSLTDLIETRHAVAHALPTRGAPSPNDVSGWVVICFLMVRSIELYLEI